MILAAALLATAPVPPAALAPPSPTTSLAEAAHALSAGRVEQARQMLRTAVAAGASGEAVDRLMADLAFATGDDGRALAGYELLLQRHPADAELLERAGIAAFRARQWDRAGYLLDRATAMPAAGWRAFDARACLADVRGDPALADRLYARALQLSPNQPRVLGNLGWSRLLRGDPAGAIAPLEEAVALAPGSQRLADNLELARAAVAGELPARRAGESDSDFAARLNDAGVVAAKLGQTARARAAFAQAIDARPDYFQRAANNLAQLDPARR